MRVLILGYDALEYDWVEKYDLKHIKQEEYSKSEINTGVLSTPVIWASFITGYLPSEHKVIGFKWENHFLNNLKELAYRIRLIKVYEKNLTLTKITSKVLRFLKVDISFPSIQGKMPTIFDYANNPIDVTNPSYSKDMSSYEELRHSLWKALGNPRAEDSVLKRAYMVFIKKREKCLNLTKKNWDLFMVHFFLPEVVQHLRWYREEEIKELYEELDETTRLFKERINEEDTLVLVISDHGQKKGLHTPHGFYSCNKRLNLHEPKITDFADIIREKLGVPTRDEIAKIKARLKSLGY